MDATGRRRNRSPCRAIGGTGGFTVVEVLLVVLLISLMLAVAVVAWYYASRGMTVRSGAEVLKHEIKRVYAMTDSGNKTNGQRDRYRIEFHGENDSPPNAYRILRQTYNGTSWTWSTVEQDKGAVVRRLGNGWATPFSGGDAGITGLSGMGDRVAAIPGEPNYGITFVSAGSIVTTGPPIGISGEKTITISSGGRSRVIKVSEYGSVSE